MHGIFNELALIMSALLVSANSVTYWCVHQYSKMVQIAHIALTLLFKQYFNISKNYKSQNWPHKKTFKHIVHVYSNFLGIYNGPLKLVFLCAMYSTSTRHLYHKWSCIALKIVFFVMSLIEMFVVDECHNKTHPILASYL